MPRPTTKRELLELGNSNFDKLFTLINSISASEQNSNFTFEDRDKNIRDVLTHLYEWHNLLLNWINSNINGDRKAFLPEGYNWKTYPEMNIKFWEKHQNTDYTEAKKTLQNSHSQVIEQISAFTDEELFVKKYFSWTGTTSLGSYCISSTSSHYDWAIKKIKKHKKLLKSNI
ncbi:MAG: ClbS/DfsB family four-helix bundle protein [Marinifilaceae bacterium]|jgi:hypothetical protein|nr:ClbS/DfsB family four-helix bundle protein [Marinifilaceae bacterium]